MSEFFENPVLLNAFKKNGKIFPPLIANCDNCSYGEKVLEMDDFTIACFDSLNLVDINDWCKNHDFDLGRTEFEEEYGERIDKLIKLGKFVVEAEFIEKRRNELWKLVNGDE